MAAFTATWGEAVALFWACHGQSAWLKVAGGAGAASGEPEVSASHREPVRTQ